jgi:hypothetical protein
MINIQSDMFKRVYLFGVLMLILISYQIGGDGLIIAYAGILSYVIISIFM